jgi:hypothetical protein
VTPAERRLAAAAACLAGPRAASILARGASPEVRAEAARLAGLGREVRLHALGCALAGAGSAVAGARAAELARRERPRIAALLSQLGQGGAPTPGVAPALARIARERLSR